MVRSNLDCCFFYGIIVDKTDLHSKAAFNGFKNPIEFLEKHELDYRPIGPVGYSQKMIIGKEIHYDYGSYVTEFNLEDKKIIKLRSKLITETDYFNVENSINLDDNEELLQINETLKQISNSSTAKFYIVTSKEGV